MLCSLCCDVYYHCVYVIFEDVNINYIVYEVAQQLFSQHVQYTMTSWSPVCCYVTVVVTIATVYI